MPHELTSGAARWCSATSRRSSPSSRPTARTAGFRGAIDFGGGDLVSEPKSIANLFARYDLDGAYLGGTLYHGLSMSVQDLARGPEGELALTGLFTDELDLGAGPLPGDLFDSSLFVHRFAP